MNMFDHIGNLTNIHLNKYKIDFYTQICKQNNINTILVGK